jgi:hypothetical protein
MGTGRDAADVALTSFGRMDPGDGVRVTRALSAVIACDKRKAFAQGSPGDEAIHFQHAARWIASLRSQ